MSDVWQTELWETLSIQGIYGVLSHNHMIATITGKKSNAIFTEKKNETQHRTEHETQTST